MTPRRPALGAVLDALTEPSNGDPPPSSWCTVPPVVIDRGAVVVVGSPYHSVRYPWATTNPAEAWEILQARDLIPMDYVGRFVCEVCAGGGVVACGLAHLPCLRCALPCVDCGDAGRVGNAVCDCVGGLRRDAVALGHRPHPPTVAALAAWASLGFAASDGGTPGILGAEELASAMIPDVPVWWGTAPAGVNTARAHGGESPAWRLLDAGFVWRRGTTHTTLCVPPLGADV